VHAIETAVSLRRWVPLAARAASTLPPASGLSPIVYPNPADLKFARRPRRANESRSIYGLDSGPAEEAEAHYRSLTEYQPKTDLGRRLWQLRLENIADGAQLLCWEEIEQEKAARRGES